MSGLAVFHQFVVQLSASQRDVVRSRLSEQGIGTLLHYPMAAVRCLLIGVAMDPAIFMEALLPRILSLPWGHISAWISGQVAERLLKAIQTAK